MSSITLKHINLSTNLDLAAVQTYSRLLVDGRSYVLKNIVYTVEGDQTNTVTIDIKGNANLIYKYQMSTDYNVDLSKFEIKHDGTSPVENSTGINNVVC